MAPKSDDISDTGPLLFPDLVNMGMQIKYDEVDLGRIAPGQTVKIPFVVYERPARRVCEFEIRCQRQAT